MTEGEVSFRACEESVGIEFAKRCFVSLSMTGEGIFTPHPSRLMPRHLPLKGEGFKGKPCHVASGSRRKGSGGFGRGGVQGRLMQA